jgi:hypothetical protein
VATLKTNAVREATVTLTATLEDGEERSFSVLRKPLVDIEVVEEDND